MGSERKGFEPSVWIKPYNGLAISRFRPLSHLSGYSLHNTDTEVVVWADQFGST